MLAGAKAHFIPGSLIAATLKRSPPTEVGGFHQEHRAEILLGFHQEQR
jgi:hypothetical protein